MLDELLVEYMPCYADCPTITAVHPEGPVLVNNRWARTIVTLMPSVKPKDENLEWGCAAVRLHEQPMLSADYQLSSE